MCTGCATEAEAIRCAEIFDAAIQMWPWDIPAGLEHYKEVSYQFFHVCDEWEQWVDLANVIQRFTTQQQSGTGYTGVVSRKQSGKPYRAQINNTGIVEGFQVQAVAARMRDVMKCARPWVQKVRFNFPEADYDELRDMINKIENRVKFDTNFFKWVARDYIN